MIEKMRFVAAFPIGTKSFIVDCFYFFIS